MTGGRVTRLLLTALLALTLQAETVYLSQHGKTYHSRRDCMALARSKRVLTADSKDAEAHGVRPCGICHRKAAAKKGDNGAWAK